MKISNIIFGTVGYLTVILTYVFIAETISHQIRLRRLRKTYKEWKKKAIDQIPAN